MAKFVSKYKINSVRLKMAGFAALLLLFAAVGLLFLIFGIIKSPYFLFGCLIWIPIPFLYRRIQILKAGADGEKQVQKLLLKLPNQYYLLSDLVLTCQNRSSQIDHLVLCDHAAYLIEVKNISGRLCGQAQAEYLNQVKKSEAKSLYNPVLQVEGHAVTLRKILRQEKIALPVYHAVYFCNQRLDCEIDFSGKAVFFKNRDGEKKLLSFLQSGAKEAVITSKELSGVVRLLRKMK